ncbi:putative ribonuclease H-like domain-containing protein [Tanacetum coccineum]|uniref:Ribonuclease H-like domain-containing protein n=1 Tax=Tanacetum coccineum TaxID=301880 RepID=A0ABQ4XA96_9ASTR
MHARGASAIFKLQKVWTLIKARLVAQGYTQEEGIDYDEVFALVARIEAISFEDPQFPDKVYKVEKALYGLHQAPRAWKREDILLVQVYVDDIIFGSTKKSLCVEFEQMMHKRFHMSSMGELTFFLGLQVIQKDDGIFISQDKYVADILKKFVLSLSMIGSLMYLTASRPDIMFVVCACARFQVTPKVSHLHAVKRIFRYLKGQPKLGLWYPMDSPFDLEAFSDTGASLDRKSTTGGCQFLGKRLISWQCKKHTIVANSTTKAEYVAAANCCGQVLWIQNQMLDYGFNFMNTKIHIDNESTTCIVKNPVFHSKTKHIEIRHHFIRDSYEKKLIQVIKIHTDHNVADLLTEAFDVSRLNLLMPVLVYAAKHSLTTVRHKLMLPDITSYCWFWTSAKVKTVNRERQIQALVDKKNVIISEISIRSDLKLDDAEGTDCLPIATIFAELERMGVTPLFSTMMVQATEDMGADLATPADSHSIPIITQPSSSKPQKKNQEGNKGRTEKVLDLEKAKTAQVKEITSLKKRVKQLEKRRKSRTSGLRRLRKVEVTLVNETQEMNDDNLMFDTGVLEEQEIKFEKVVEEPVVSVATTTKSILVNQKRRNQSVTTAATTVIIVRGPGLRGIIYHDSGRHVPASTKTFSSSQSQLPQVKDKGKGKMVEPEVPLKKKDQVALNEEMARNLEALVDKLTLLKKNGLQAKGRRSQHS